MYKLTIPGEPVAKARPRFVNGHTFTPAKTKNYEVLVKELFCTQYGNVTPLNEPISAAVAAYFSIPQSWSKKKKQQALNDEIRPTNKMDCDNIAKAVLDALNGLAYHDDGSVVCLLVIKRYSDRPRVEVTIGRIEGDE